MLELHEASGIEQLGSVKWQLMLCLVAVYLICYFSLWKGISTSGKVRCHLASLLADDRNGSRNSTSHNSDYVDIAAHAISIMTDCEYNESGNVVKRAIVIIILFSDRLATNKQKNETETTHYIP